jgi:hypothetical protein
MAARRNSIGHFPAPQVYTKNKNKNKKRFPALPQGRDPQSPEAARPVMYF